MIAEIGAEALKCLFEGDPKICLTALVSIDAAGVKSPSESRGSASRVAARHANLTISD
jgi:hypothetical protein